MTDARPYDQDWTDPWAREQWPYMESKLIAAGAFPNEVIDFRTQWLHDPTWPHEDKVRLIALGDGKLRLEVVKTRIENQTDRETEAQQVLRESEEERTAEAITLRQEAEEMSAYEADSIMRWVGGDLRRARVMLAVEEAHRRSRSEVLASLLDVIQRCMS
jgi:hypothetical protein